MKKSPDDGLEWLRDIRHAIDAKCAHDPARVLAFYREAAAKIPHKTCRSKPAGLSRRRLKLAA